jgi:hypothetical protein
MAYIWATTPDTGIAGKGGRGGTGGSGGGSQATDAKKTCSQATGCAERGADLSDQGRSWREGREKEDLTEQSWFKEGEREDSLEDSCEPNHPPSPSRIQASS